ncbi:hypothetical protein OM076_33980 [Solirubrobacter ginsenosidimutans]|uniref:Uncharacterized protein n=1 Tax=Solirubrobacter ginsenosidimutans TaxID=490573 RepID=A0A9X3S9T1_9ACTN|nr:hypothetical protein [Solirubrobacter ginsenosidimutans]MDA0165328.1 hypothetical protein [Solirubrobacter ginsenosidimutans]
MSEDGVTAYRPGSAITAVSRATPVRPDAGAWTTLAPRLDVRTLGVTSTGVVWGGSWGGVIAYDPAGSSYQRYGSEHGLPGNTVLALCIDHADRVWTVHAPTGVACFDQEQWRTHPSLRDTPLLAIAPAREGGVWVASSRRLYRLGGIDEPVVAGPDVTFPRALLETDAGVLVGGTGGVYRGDERMAPGACAALVDREDGDVWTATATEVFQLGGDTSQACPGTLALVAAGGVLYAVSADGVTRFSDGETTPCPGATAAAADGPALWIARERSLNRLWWRAQGLPTWEDDALSPTPEDTLSDLGRCAVADRGGVLAGTARGLVRVRAGAHTHDPAAADVLQLVRHGGETWLLARPHGIGRVRDDADFRGAQPPGVPIALAAPLHALTTAGLFRFDDGEWVRVGLPLQAAARCIAQAPDGTWWVGTSSGVYRLDRAGAWQLAGERPGPLVSAVRCLAMLQHRLWVATDKGVWRYDGGWHALEIAGVDLERITAMAPAATEHCAWFADPDGVRRCDLRTLEVTEEAMRWDTGVPGTAFAIVETDDGLTLVGTGGIGSRNDEH